MTQENVCGHYIYDKKLIEINNKLDKETQAITLMHEVIHSTFHRSGIHNAKVSHDAEEIIADQIAKVLVENFDFKLKK